MEPGEQSWICANLPSTKKVKSFAVLGRQLFEYNVDDYQFWDSRDYALGVYSGTNTNRVGECIKPINGVGWHICDNIYEGDIVCLESS